MANMIPISTVTVGSGGASAIGFTNIPSTYTDLVVKLSGRSDRANKQAILSMAFNASSSSYTNKFLEGDGSTAVSFSTSDNAYNVGFVVASTMTANTFSSTEIYIPNYASANYKSYSVDQVDEGNQTTVYSHLIAGLWSNTAPINQITFTPTSYNFVQYSTATLYGIRKY